VVPEILNGVYEFMKKWNFKRIDDFRGRLSYKNIPDPLLYERSQFMKYFSNRE
jgi:dihydroorotate dehydrogenase (fumarate)